MTAGPDTCPLCGRRALADRAGEGTVCDGCGSAFETYRATGRRRYVRVAAAYRPLESRLSGSWLSQAEVIEMGRNLTLGRARWVLLLSAAAIVTITLFTCALGSAFALAPGIRDSQARIAQANAGITNTLTFSPTRGATATFGPAPTAAVIIATPPRSPTPTAPGPLNSPLPTPGRATESPNPTATRAQPTAGTPNRPAPVPTQSPTEAIVTIVLPPTFTPVAALPLPAETPSPTVATTPITTVTVTVGGATATSTPDLVATETATATPTATPAAAAPTATPTATATSSADKSPFFGQVSIQDVNYRGSLSLNEADEFVELRNGGDTLVAVQGWTIRHRQGSSRIALPPMTLLAGQTCRIYTAPPAPSGTCGPITFGNYQNLWPNDADTLQLLDASSLLVAEFAYPP